MDKIIAIDIGTTGLKLALFNRNGKTVATNYVDYINISSRESSYQDPEIWWKALIMGLHDLTSYTKTGDLKAIILGGQMQDLILIKGNEVIHPIIMYYDTRAGKEIETLKKVLGDSYLKKVTGNIQDASSILGKLLWLKNNKPEILKNTETILFGAHDYISWKMTGSKNTDYTTASTTGLLDIKNNIWAKNFIKKIGIKDSLLPNLVPADNYDGNLTMEAGLALGIADGIPVFHGSGDVGTATIGAGAGLPGSIYCYIGTSGWIASSSPQYDIIIDPETGIYNLRHPDPTRLIRVGPITMAGGAIEWALKEISTFSLTNRGYSQLDETVALSEPGCNGVIFLPYLAGERCPFRDPDARGAFIGITKETKRGDILRSVFEGIALAMRSIKEIIVEDNFSDKELFLVGGGARLDSLSQIFADIFNCKVSVIADSKNVGLRGSFAIVGKALGWMENYTLLPGMLKITRQSNPYVNNVKKYDILYSIFKNLNTMLKNSFSELAKFKRGDLYSP